MPKIILFVLILLNSQKIAVESFLKLVIWNVGQGQWVTLLTSTHCIHIDTGGEKINWPKVQKLCHNKKNRVYLTHYDWDHINFISKLKYHIHDTCLALETHYPVSKAKRRKLSKVPLCKDPMDLVKKIYAGSSFSANHQSRVFLLLNKVVIPGDSLGSQEKLWKAKIPNLVNILILGHHGSKTSTTKTLLSSLQLKQAVVSARKNKYGHPHGQVTQRLKKFRVPLLATEDWGNIHLLLTN